MSPLSKDPEKRAKQLANLNRTPPTPPAGNRRAQRHGAYAAVGAEEREGEMRRIFDALSADLPLRDPDGGPPAADGVAVELLADCLVQLRRARADVEDHGWRDPKTGDPRPVVDRAQRLRREAFEYAEALGLTPRGRLKLGLDLARGVDLARQAAEDFERERTEGGGDA